MISQFTWPNFRAGSDKDGTQVLIQERNFAHDVKYGKTKIFIRSPGTLFALETVRVYKHGVNRALCKCRYVRFVDRASRIFLSITNLMHFFWCKYLFISLLYMFQATRCSSSGESNCINITLCRWLPTSSHLRRVICTRCINTIQFSWWWALCCSKHVEKWNKYIKKVHQVGYWQEL